MPTIRLRVTGPRPATEVLLTALEGVEGVEDVEEEADLMPHLDDEDSSSAGLSDNEGGDEVSAIQVEAHANAIEQVQALAEEVAIKQGLVVEYLDRF